jgi:hypothetical protein
VVAWCAQDSLDHWYYSRAREQIHLPRIFLKHPCKSKTLDGPLAIVMRRRLDGDMRRVAPFAIFDTEETRISMIGRAQAQKDVKKRT